MIALVAGLTLNEKLPILRNAMSPEWSQTYFARRLGVTLASVKNWERDLNQGARKYTREIADLFGVDRAWLEDDAQDRPIKWAKRPKEKPVRILEDQEVPEHLRSFMRGDMALLPVWRGVAASSGDECYFVASDSPEYMEIPAFLIGPDLDNYVICIVAGLSMSPRLLQGDKAIVRLDSNPPKGTLVVARRSDGQAFIKGLRVGAKGFELHSVNAENFKPITDVAGWVFVGSVTAILHDYEVGQPNIEWDFRRPLKA